MSVEAGVERVSPIISTRKSVVDYRCVRPYKADTASGSTYEYSCMNRY